jgi:hypothetical protein
MPSDTLYSNHHVHPTGSWAARAAAVRTFGGFILFASCVLISVGGYLVAEQLANPMSTEALATAMAAAILWTGLLLLYYFLNSRKRGRRKRVHAKRSVRSNIFATSHSINPQLAFEWQEQRRDLPFQRCYVDTTRIGARR